MQPAVFVLMFAASLGLAPAPAQDAPADVGERIEEEREFMQMTQPADEPEECVSPKPPRDLAETAYLRNGHWYMLEILAMERWEETGSCECFYDEVSWQDAVAASERFVVSSNSRVPFDMDAMRAAAEDLIARRQKACGD